VNLLPRLTFKGLSDYFLFATGIVVGAALFTGSMDTIEANLKKNGGV